MTIDPLQMPVDSDEAANKFLEAYVERANQALHAWWSQVGPMQPTMVYETILKMEEEMRIDASSERARTNMEMMKSVLRAFSECYEITVKLKEEVDRYSSIPDIAEAIAAARAEDEYKESGGRLN